jgi:hypothetical protein
MNGVKEQYQGFSPFDICRSAIDPGIWDGDGVDPA